MTATHDITIRAGNSGTVGDTGNELGLVVNVLVGAPGAEVPFDMTGQTAVFRVLQGGNAMQVLRKDSLTGGVTLTTGTDRNGAASAVPNKITVPISVAESRTLEAAGAGLTYDLERRQSGNQRTLLTGNIFIEPGANDDV
jgi:hypothetical protein